MPLTQNVVLAVLVVVLIAVQVTGLEGVNYRLLIPCAATWHKFPIIPYGVTRLQLLGQRHCAWRVHAQVQK
jgi:hypothetical protein